MLVCTAPAAGFSRRRGPRYPSRIGRVVGPLFVGDRQAVGYWKVDLFAAGGKVARAAIVYLPRELRRVTVLDPDDIAPLIRAAAKRAAA